MNCMPETFDTPHEPVARRRRVALTTCLEVLLIGIMLSSSASWVVRAMVIAAVSAFLLGMNAYWRDHGMPSESHL